MAGVTKHPSFLSAVYINYSSRFKWVSETYGNEVSAIAPLTLFTKQLSE